MKKFEYKKVEVSKLRIPNHMELCEKKLNEYGDEGWDFLLIDYGQAIFKREKVSTQTKKVSTSPILHIVNAYGGLGQCLMSSPTVLENKNEDITKALDFLLCSTEHTKVVVNEVTDDMTAPLKPVVNAYLVPKLETKYNVKLERDTDNYKKEMTFSFTRIRDLFVAIKDITKDMSGILIAIKQITNTEGIDFTIDNLGKGDIETLIDSHDKGTIITYSDIEEDSNFGERQVVSYLVNTNKGYVNIQAMNYLNE
ncbi:hypothetical protein ACQUY5_23700 [Bacillus cereus]|uniref:hypothetical protein n=1 Tax=Bacillus cereus TaxID=1396 RepID=UPI003D1792D1